MTCIAVDGEFRRAASGHADGTVLLWGVDDVQGGIVARHREAVTSLAIGTDELVSICGERSVWITDLTTLSPRCAFESTARVLRYVRVGHSDAAFYVVGRSFDGHLLRATAVADGLDSPVGLSLRHAERDFANGALLSGGRALTVSTSGVIEVWSRDAKEPLHQITTGLEPPLSWALVGETFVAGGTCGVLAAWNSGTAALVFRTDLGSAISSVALDESGAFVFIVEEGGTLRIIAAATGEPVAERIAERPFTCCAVTSRLKVLEAGYREHADGLSPVLVVAGMDSGQVEFIDCTGLRDFG